MKGNLLLGTARGKLGDVVAKVVHGEQILSKHQPKVHNPRTPLQVEQREIFGRATQALKEMRGLFDEVGLISVYNRKQGASKNIRNTFMPLSIASQRNQLIGSKEFIKVKSPTDVISRIGNNLVFGLRNDPIDEEGNYFTITPLNQDGEDAMLYHDPPVTISFGSDVPLGNKLHVFAVNAIDITCGDTCRNGGVMVFRKDIDITLVDSGTCPPVGDGGLYKQEGFEFTGSSDGSVAAFAEWPYIYKLGESFTEEPYFSGGEGVVGSAGSRYSVGFYVVYDSRGVLVSSGTMNSLNQ